MSNVSEVESIKTHYILNTCVLHLSYVIKANCKLNTLTLLLLDKIHYILNRLILNLNN